MRTIPDAKDFDADLSQPLAGETQLIGHGLSHIKHAATNERTAVIDADFGGFSILEICHSDEARKREGFVGGAAGPGPELFADGGFAGEDQKMFAVMRGHAGFDMTNRLARSDRMVAHAAQGVGLVFVAVIGRCASAEKDRDEQKERGFGHGASIWMAARRDTGPLQKAASVSSALCAQLS